MLGPLASIAGYVAPAIAAHQQEALRLTAALAVPEAPQLLRSLGMSALTAEDFPATLRIGAQLQAAGERLGEEVLVVEGAYLLGMAAFWRTDFAAARTHLETAVARYRPADGRSTSSATARTRRWRASAGWATRCGSSASPTRRGRRATPPWPGPTDRAAVQHRHRAAVRPDAGPRHGRRARPARARRAAGGVGPKPPPIQLSADALVGYLAVLDGGHGRARRDRRGHPRGGSGARPPARPRSWPASGSPQPSRPGTRPGGGGGRVARDGGAAAVWAPEARRIPAAFPNGPTLRNAPGTPHGAGWRHANTLVVGATGTVGHHLVPQLVHHGLPGTGARPQPSRRPARRPTGRGRQPRRPRLAASRRLDGVDAVYLACGNRPAQAASESHRDRRRGRHGHATHRQTHHQRAAIGSPAAFADAPATSRRACPPGGVDHVLLEPHLHDDQPPGCRRRGPARRSDLFLPGAGAKVAMIDPRDVADVAAVALTETVGRELRPDRPGRGHVRRRRRRARARSRAGGSDSCPSPTTPPWASWSPRAPLEWYATNVVAVFGLLRQGVQAQTRDTVHTVLGREPRSLSAFVRDHAAVFADSR